ncbi:MAG: hypothetical protein ABII12_00320 [Planctomycetota bacterium]
MLGRQERGQEDLFVAGPLRDSVDDHAGVIVDVDVTTGEASEEK